MGEYMVAQTTGVVPMSLPEISFVPEMTCPLDEVRIIDMSRLVSGNMVSLQLADFGAEVIKIEDPKCRDPLRAWQTAGMLAQHLERSIRYGIEPGSEVKLFDELRRVAVGKSEALKLWMDREREALKFETEQLLSELK